MNEIELVRLYAKSWNNLKFEIIEPFLSEDVVYESQQVFEPLVGKGAVSEYLRGKMATIKKNLLTSDIYAEIGYCRSQAGQRVQVLSAYDGRPCVLMAQGNRNIPLALVLLEVDEGKIKRIDLCTEVPHPSSAERTGEYPR